MEPRESPLSCWGAPDTGSDRLTTRILQEFQALLQAQGLSARQDSLGDIVPAGI